MQISVYLHTTFRYWLSKNAFKYIELRLQRSSTIQSHTYTHRMLFAEVFFFVSQKYAFYFQHFFLHCFFLSQHHLHRCKQTHVNIAKSLRFKRQRSNILRKCVGGKMVNKFLLHIYFHRRFKQIRIAAQKFAQFKSIIDI